MQKAIIVFLSIILCACAAKTNTKNVTVMPEATWEEYIEKLNASGKNISYGEIVSKNGVFVDKNGKPFTGVSVLKMIYKLRYVEGVTNGEVVDSNSVLFTYVPKNSYIVGETAFMTDKGYVDDKGNLITGYVAAAEEHERLRIIAAELTNGVYEGLYIEYKDGFLSVITNYVNGKTEGIATVYYASGNIESEETYHNGNKQGPKTYYYDNSNKIKLMSVEYSSNKEISKVTRYYEDGSSKQYEISIEGTGVCYNPDGSIDKFTSDIDLHLIKNAQYTKICKYSQFELLTNEGATTR